MHIAFRPAPSAVVDEFLGRVGHARAGSGSEVVRLDGRRDGRHARLGTQPIGGHLPG
jgi:hypothetical protein